MDAIRNNRTIRVSVEWKEGRKGWQESTYAMRYLRAGATRINGNCPMKGFEVSHLMGLHLSYPGVVLTAGNRKFKIKGIVE